MLSRSCCGEYNAMYFSTLHRHLPLSLFNAVLNILFATVTGDIVFFYASYYYLSSQLLTLDCKPGPDQ